MDFLNELFGSGSEMGELKRHQKVQYPAPQASYSSPPNPFLIDRRGNKEILHERRVHRVEEGCTPP